MIRLTRLNGSELSLNPDLIHRAEETPDTVLTLIDGSRYVVLEPIEELITRVVGYRARVIAQAGILAEAAMTTPDEAPADRLRPRAPVLAAVPADEQDEQDEQDEHGEQDHDVDGRRTAASVVRLRARRA